jgi:hypothetical protein
LAPDSFGRGDLGSRRLCKDARAACRQQEQDRQGTGSGFNHGLVSFD